MLNKYKAFRTCEVKLRRYTVTIEYLPNPPVPSIISNTIDGPFRKPKY